MKNIIYTLFIMSILLNGCSAQSVPDFDGERAFEFLEKQCEFGPRVPGTPAHIECRDYFVETLKPLADQVTTQQFLWSFGNPRKTTTGYNVIARFAPQKRQRVLLCAHWDTRPWADSDPDISKRKEPVMGANDGASGVAVLLHIAELLAKQPTSIGIDIVLFDAEDAGDHRNNRSWAQGSAAFVREHAMQYAPRYVILLDMIGDKDLEIPQEYHSLAYAPQIVEKVWNIAAELGIAAFTNKAGPPVYDDHIPFLERGIPAIDIIDFDYEFWHTVQDVPENCSAASLEQVGRVVTTVIYREK